MSRETGTDRRPRSADATRAAILDAARARFARESYDTVGVRDIAADVGVDPALVSRYSGGKEELFSAVLATCGDSSGIWSGDRATFGERVSRVLVEEPLDDAKLESVLIMMRSAGSPRAADVIRRMVAERLSGLAVDYLGGGSDAPALSTLISSVMMGCAIHRAISGGPWLDDGDERERYRQALAGVLQSLVDAAAADGREAQRS